MKLQWFHTGRMSAFLWGFLLWGEVEEGTLVEALKSVRFIIHDKKLKVWAEWILMSLAGSMLKVWVWALKPDYEPHSLIKCGTYINVTRANTVVCILSKQTNGIFLLYELIRCSALELNMWQSEHILREKCQKEEMQNCQKWKLFGNCFTSLLKKLFAYFVLQHFYLTCCPMM